MRLFNGIALEVLSEVKEEFAGCFDFCSFTSDPTDGTAQVVI